MDGTNKKILHPIKNSAKTTGFIITYPVIFLIGFPIILALGLASS